MIEIIYDRNALANIRDKWNELADLFGSPLLDYEWFYACSSAFYETGELRCVIVYSDSTVTGVAPLVIMKRRGFEYLEVLGASFLGEPCGILYDNDESLRILLKGILRLRRPLHFQRISNGTPVSKYLNQKSARSGILIQRNTSRSAYIPIDNPWVDFYNSLSSRRRYDLRRAIRRAEKFGEVSYRILCPKPEDLEPLLEVAFKIENTGWKGRKGSSLLANKKLNSFFKIYSQLASEKKILRLGFLYIDDNPAAMLIGLEYHNRFWVLKIGFDEKYAKCSPGILLVHETIRYAFEHNLKSYEFLGSDEPWLRMWTKDNYRRYKSISYFPFSYQGIGVFCADILRYVAAKVRLKTA